MGIYIDDHELNQDQLDAVVPVINEYMQGAINKKKMELKCRKAMVDAGCPIPGDELNAVLRSA